MYNRNAVNFYLRRERECLLKLKSFIENEYIRLQVEELALKAALRKAEEAEKKNVCESQPDKSSVSVPKLKIPRVTSGDNIKKGNLSSHELEANLAAKLDNLQRREELEKEWSCTLENDWSKCLEPLSLDPGLCLGSASEDEDDFSNDLSVGT